MRRYRVEITSRARAQVLEISRWWRANRGLRPGLFGDEFRTARRQLARFPLTGPNYDAPGFTHVRRLLLVRTQHHVYYLLDDALKAVIIVAVWHTARGDEPPL